MLVITDSIREGVKYSGVNADNFRPVEGRNQLSEIISEDFLDEIFDGKKIFYASVSDEPFWKLLFLTEHSPKSQYDILCSRMNNGSEQPDRIQLLALEGENFHGQRGRSWQALRGNIHLSCYLKPNADAGKVKLGFSMLPARSVIETIDEIPELKGMANIKWVNDIFIDYAKVSGFLAATRLNGMKFSEVVLGIGLNVETNPAAEPTAYVPNSASLNDFISEGNLTSAPNIFKILSKKIAANYQFLINNGYTYLLDFYKSHSTFTGRKGILTSDEHDGTNIEIAYGTIDGIGENMEIIIDGIPYSRGRLIVI